MHNIDMASIEEVNTKDVVRIKNLNFCYDTGAPLNINGLDCVIPANSKVILVGANGAGKSTLLRILTGVIYLGLESDEFDVCGGDKPHDQAKGVAYLGGVWKRRRTGFEGIEPYSMDIAAREMMKKWQEENLARRDELVRVLGINLDWRMHECSDGQRKKVRIMLKLLRPFKLCVIDEFAADLDIFSRARFFDYLSKECELRGAAVVYATHIFDQADKWATHVAFMQLDKTLSPVHHLASFQPYQEILARSGEDRAYCPMYVLVLEELERGYKQHSHLFDENNACLTDLIMEEQASEKAADRHFSETGKGYESGRVARELAVVSMDEMRRKRREDEKAREAADAAKPRTTSSNPRFN